MAWKQPGLSRAVVVIGAALSGIALGEAAAANASTFKAAAVRCVGASCNGRDPVDMGCDNDAQTVASVGTSDPTVSLRWSKACQANWAQVVSVPIWGIHFWVANKVGNKQEYGSGWFGAAESGRRRGRQADAEGVGLVEHGQRPEHSGPRLR